MHIHGCLHVKQIKTHTRCQRVNWPHGGTAVLVAGLCLHNETGDGLMGSCEVPIVKLKSAVRRSITHGQQLLNFLSDSGRSQRLLWQYLEATV